VAVYQARQNRRAVGVDDDLRAGAVGADLREEAILDVQRASVDKRRFDQPRAQPPNVVD
jgi:hypothetical protein